MLSVIVLAKNEEDRIKTCLESVKWADEIIVCDNGSTDKTLEIARKYTSHILKLYNQDFATLRNNAFKQTKGDWILYVDADERVLDDLKRELESLIVYDSCSAYALSRRNIIFGKEVSYGPYKKDWVIRFLKRIDFEEWVGKVHESPKFRGKLGYSKNSLLHLTHRNVDQIVLKSLEWSKIDAGLRKDANHPDMSGWRLLRIFITEIFKQGFTRKGFFNGTVGVMDSVLQVFSMVITYIRLWEMQQPEPLSKDYEEIDQKLIEDNFKYP